MPTPETSKPILLIPDVHQDYRFLRRGVDLAREIKAGEIILLGDLVDPKREAYDSVEALAKTVALVRTILRGPVPAVLLMGNHDLDALRLTSALNGLRDQPELMDRVLDQFPGQAGILRHLVGNSAWEFVVSRQVYAVARAGHLLTHAGVHAGILPEPGATPGVTADYLNRECPGRLAGADEDPLLGAGETRGGPLERGGILWQDFEAEFEDDCPFPQIVGHTIGEEPRRKGDSICLDAHQRYFGILHPDGGVEAVPRRG